MGRQEADAVRVIDAAPQLAPLPKAGSASTRPVWRDSIAPYERPSWGRGLLDLATSVVPYVALSVLMYVSLGELTYWATLALAIPTAGFLMRTFIVFHDCTHGSFLPSRRANLWVGRLSGLLVFQPFANWRHTHAVHHGTAGDLDRRGTGDILTLTFDEYVASSWRKRLGYRLFRNPLIMFGIGPLWSLMLGPRLWSRSMRPRQRRSVVITNLVLAVLLGAICWLVGWQEWLLVQMPTRDPRRHGRRLAVLRPAPVRGRLLGERRELGLRGRGAARELVPEAAAALPVLHRQHRPPPRPPLERQGPELQPAARARRESDLPGRPGAERTGRRRRGPAQGDRPAGRSPAHLVRGPRAPRRGSRRVAGAFSSRSQRSPRVSAWRQCMAPGNPSRASG